MMDRAASIEDHVTCSICMDLYNDPLALPCLHSFCRRCIQGLFSSALVFKCPECRSDVKLGPRGIDDIPKNFQLGGIVDSYKRENVDYRHGRQEARDERSFCTQHRMTCQLMCRTCTESVCLKCIVEKHSGHKLALLSTKRDNQDELTGEVNCYMHNRSHKLYCTDCERLICLECTVNEHCHHSLSNIEESHGYHLERLNGMLSELDDRQRLLNATQKTCRTLAQKTQTDAQKKRQELTLYFSRLRDSLERRESAMRSELDQREQLVTQYYMAKAESAKRTEKLVATAIDDVRRLTTENKIIFLQNYPSKISGVSSLLTDESTDSLSQKKGVADVTLVTATSTYEKELANIHWQWPREELKPVRKAPPLPRARKSTTSRIEQPAVRHTQRRTLTVGSTVKRGDCWRDGMTDGGPGHIGTVSQICVDADMYSVRWPNGKTGNYKYAHPHEEEITPP